MPHKRSEARRPRVGKRTGPILVAVLSTALLFGCTDGRNPNPDETHAATFEFRDGLTCPATNQEPTKGGQLTLAMLTEPTVLDPAVARAPAATGGMEVLTIFDPLLRYDPETGEYVPQLAESVEVNDDFTAYTVTLRPDATFSDGTPVNTEAVKWSMDRYAASPTAPDGPLWNQMVDRVEAVDDLTVAVHLKQAWSTFEVMLAFGAGAIVAPSSGEGDDYSPIGAGPFTLQQHTPRESITMAANENYWAGPPHLDDVRFIYLGSPQTSVETMQAGGADAALLRDPNMVEDLFSDDKHCGNIAMVGGGSVLLINAQPGKPGEDTRVRRAMQLAVNPQIVHDRAFDGKGIADAALFPEYSRWHAGVAGPDYDPEEASKLIQEAKADGFDGTVRYVGTNTGEDIALAVKAQWEAVGLTVDLDLSQSPVDMINKVYNQDYDVVYWAIGVMESDVYGRISATLQTGGSQTFGVYTSPERDALIDEFRTAPDDDSQIKILGQLQNNINDEVPFVGIGAISDVIAWPAHVHGIQPTGQGVVLLGEAWIEK